MDNGTLALILSPIAVIIAAFITARVAGRGNRESNDVRRIELLLEGYENARKSDGERIGKLEQKVLELEERDVDRQNQLKQQGRQIGRMKTVIKEWFDELRAAWPIDQPMPMPTDEDLELLGITQTRP